MPEQPVAFEGVVFQGVSDADAYLSFKFGDYMKLPPESKRKTHPVSDFKIPETGATV